MSENTDHTNSKPPSLDRLSLLWRRVAERKIVQWSVAYVALAYGIQHGIVLTREAFDWPHAIEQISMLLLALGLPVTVTFAWYHGEQASRRISGPELTIISILLAIGSLFFYVLVRPSDIAATPALQQAGVTTARAAAASPKGAISLAVLPFVNLSSDKEQEFFSDGMTEEITAALAKVPDLRVVARTSAFEFKGQNKDIQAIGQQLHATHLIEGSVRKAGDRVRITAQLIKADDGSHIWAESYDRELKDVFAVQEDIARAITSSLHMTLGLKPGENLVNNRAIDPETHEKYLRAKALVDGRGGVQDFAQAASLFNEVVTRSPNYAPAWSGLGGAYYLIANDAIGNDRMSLEDARREVDALRTKAEMAIQHALVVDPYLPAVYGGMAVLEFAVGKPLEARELFQKALALDPADAGTLEVYATRIGTTGAIKEALADVEKARAIEPFQPQILLRVADFLWLDGQNEAAIAVAKTLRPGNRAPTLARIYASMGHYGEAADSLNEIATDPASPAAEAARLLRQAPKQIPTRALPPLPANLEFVYLHVGAPERALVSYERRAEVRLLGPNYIVWHPSYASVRKTERFKALMRKVGLVDYWRAKGWPEFCHPTTADDFACN